MQSSHPSETELAGASLRAIAAFAARNATRIYPILQHHYGEHSGVILTLICRHSRHRRGEAFRPLGSGGKPAGREIPRQDVEGHQCTRRRRLHRVRRLVRGQLPRSRQSRGRGMGGQERSSGRGVRPFLDLRAGSGDRIRRDRGDTPGLRHGGGHRPGGSRRDGRARRPLGRGPFRPPLAFRASRMVHPVSTSRAEIIRGREATRQAEAVVCRGVGGTSPDRDITKSQTSTLCRR